MGILGNARPVDVRQPPRGGVRGHGASGSLRDAAKIANDNGGHRRPILLLGGGSTLRWCEAIWKTPVILPRLRGATYSPNECDIESGPNAGSSGSCVRIQLGGHTISCPAGTGSQGWHQGNENDCRSVQLNGPRIAQAALRDNGSRLAFICVHGFNPRILRHSEPRGETNRLKLDLALRGVTRRNKRAITSVEGRE